MWGPPRRNHTEKSPRFDIPAQKISIEGKEISTDYDDIDKDDDDNADTFSFLNINIKLVHQVWWNPNEHLLVQGAKGIVM